MFEVKLTTPQVEFLTWAFAALSRSRSQFSQTQGKVGELGTIKQTQEIKNRNYHNV
jgi:hypothetical protein